MVNILIGLLCIFLIPFLLPQSALQRFISGFIAIIGSADAVDDSSGLKRLGRVTDCWEIIKSHPLGYGWGSSGWVHSDLLQFTASVGWVPGLVLVYFLFLVCYKLFLAHRNRIQKGHQHKPYFIMFLLFLAVVFQLAINGIYNLPQTAVPFFMVISCGYYTLIHNKRRIMYSPIINEHPQ